MLRIISECKKRGHQATVYTGSWEGDVPDDVEIVLIKHFCITNHSRVASFHRKLLQQLQTAQHDMVVGFNKIPGLDLYYCGDYCYVDRSYFRHSFFYRLTPRFWYYSYFERSVFGVTSNTKVLSLSDCEKTTYQQHYLTPDSRFLTLPPTLEKARWKNLDNLPSRSQIRSSLNVPQDHNMLLLIGSGFATKGLDRAIIALASLPNALKQKTQLYVAGQDKKNKFVRLAKRLKVIKQVHFLGGRSDVPALMRAGDLLLHPAYAETAGGVLLEAIVSGLPVLATPVCGYAPHINHAQAGHVLRKPFSQQELNNKLHEMLLSDQKTVWRDNGIAYRRKSDLYIMPQQAVDYIETEYAQRHSSLEPTQSSNQSLYICNELRQTLHGDDLFNQIMTITGKLYRQAPGRQTLRFTQGAKDYFLKIHTGVGWGEIIKNIVYLRAPVVSALNEWHGVHRLQDLDVDTMTVAAYGIEDSNPATKRSFIVTEALPSEISLEDFCRNWQTNPPKTKRDIRLKRWILNKVIETARVIHENGANHRDFYLCHFLLDMQFDNDQVSTKSKLYLIDLHRMQIRRKTPERWAVKDIAGLYYSSQDIGLTQRDWLRFMRGYKGKPLREILNNDMAFWKKVLKRGNKLYESERRKSLAAEQIPQQTMSK